MGFSRAFFSNERWARVAPAIRSLTRRGPVGDARRFIEAVVWMARSGAPWRDLAPWFGDWQKVYRRFRRWAVANRWEQLRQLLSKRHEGELLLIDSTIVKAHPHAAGARKAFRDAAEGLGRSRGGFTTKLHALVTERGELVRYVLTGGEVHDVTQAPSLVRGREGNTVVGDRAYDSDAFLAHVRARRMKPVIPARSNRKRTRRLDRTRYAKRNVIERWFGRLKQHRRVATRYDKTSASYLGFIAVSAGVISLTGWG